MRLILKVARAQPSFQSTKQLGILPYLAAEGFIEFLVLLKVYNFYLRVPHICNHISRNNS